MIKLTMLYGQPTDKNAFEDYYAATHLPLVAKMEGFSKSEYTIFMEQPGAASPFYRMAEFWFNGPEKLQDAMASAAGQAVAADLTNFATGGVSVLVGMVMDF